MISKRLFIGIILFVLYIFPAPGRSNDSAEITKAEQVKIDQKAEIESFGIKINDPSEVAYLMTLVTGKTSEEKTEILRQVSLLIQGGLEIKKAGLAVELASARIAAQAKEAQENEAEKSFLGIDWGMGISASFDTDSTSRVKKAEIVNGVVRVEEESNIALGIVLDAHYFFTVHEKDDRATVGAGPFIAIQTSGDNLIDSWALGGMLGFRRDPAKSTSFNLGLGVRVEPGVKVLGDGLVENQPLPEGETDIRYKTEDRLGIVVVFSASF